MVREMEEETGLENFDITSIAAIYSHTYQETLDSPLVALHHIGIIYQLALQTFDVENEMNGTTDLSKWLTEEEARKLPLTPLGEFGVSLAWPPDGK
jgi:8-oxo-dGTP pyrophosphatase MutT (NUDIX family)